MYNFSTGTFRLIDFGLAEKEKPKPDFSSGVKGDAVLGSKVDLGLGKRDKAKGQEGKQKTVRGVGRWALGVGGLGFYGWGFGVSERFCWCRLEMEPLGGGPRAFARLR